MRREDLPHYQDDILRKKGIAPKGVDYGLVVNEMVENLEVSGSNQWRHRNTRWFFPFILTLVDRVTWCLLPVGDERYPIELVEVCKSCLDTSVIKQRKEKRRGGIQTKLTRVIFWDTEVRTCRHYFLKLRKTKMSTSLDYLRRIVNRTCYRYLWRPR